MKLIEIDKLYDIYLDLINEEKTHYLNYIYEKFPNRSKCVGLIENYFLCEDVYFNTFDVNISCENVILEILKEILEKYKKTKDICNLSITISIKDFLKKINYLSLSNYKNFHKFLDLLKENCNGKLCISIGKSDEFGNTDSFFEPPYKENYLDKSGLKDGSKSFKENIFKKYKNEGFHTNKYVSKSEKDVLKYIQSIYSDEILENETSIVKNNNYRTYELDIYLPKLKLGIDFNGSYWHSTLFKDKFYHQRKTECCRKAGINIIHIYEDKWNETQEEIKNILKECINKTYKNILSNENGVLTGLNDYPIFGNYKILEIGEPELCKVGNLEYYDSGKIKYRRLENECNKD